MTLLGRISGRDALRARRLTIELLESRYLLTTIRMADWNTFTLPNTGDHLDDFETVLSAIGTEVIQGNAQRIDILALQETDDVPSGGSIDAIEFIFESLYVGSDYEWSISTVDAGNRQTGFVYDTSTVALIEALEVPGSLTHTILRGKFRPESTLGESDFYVYSVHLKAGTTASDRNDRTDESLILRADADALGEGANVLFVGDFNMQSSNEAAYTNIVASGTAHMRDLAGDGATGTWNFNPAFKHLHTQDPRTGGSGMDDRFDIMFGTDELFDGTGFEFVDGSYTVFGNDGTHTFDASINTGPNAGDPVLDALASLSDHLPLVADFEIISGPGVRIVETGGQTKVAEGGISDIYNVVLNTVPSANVTVTVQPSSQVNLGLGAGVAVNLLFTPGNALTPQPITVTAVDDAAPEASHSTLITHTAVSSDSNYNGISIEQLPVRITDNDVQFLINEIDSDTPGTDAAEFVEIYDGGIGNLPLDDMTVVFFNGAGDASYFVFSLDGYTTDANGYFVIGNSGVAGVDVTFANNTLQNGPDAVALLAGSFLEGGVLADVVEDNIIDAIVYETNDADDVELITVLLDSGQLQADENANSASASHSLARVPNGGGSPRQTASFVAQTPTPGAANVTSGEGVVITQTGGGVTIIEGGSGDSYNVRLLSVPTHDVTITLDPDAEVNLGMGAGVAIQLIFTPASALTDQTVNVSAVDNLDIEGIHSGVIVHTVASTDSGYNGLSVPNATATIGDNDAPAPTSTIVISEIMYNPGSNESRTMMTLGIAEWVEIVNTGPAAVDISGWKLDDEDTGTDNDWSAIPGGTVLNAGQVAVLFDEEFVDEVTFGDLWNVPEGVKLIPLSVWGSLSNSPSAVPTLNEVLQLLDGGLAVMDTVNFDDSNFWPTGVNGQSIYLTDLAAHNNAGQFWARSQVGVDGAITPDGAPFNNSEAEIPDVGSPGVVPTTPEGLPGDFNGDEVVDAGDYSVWRNNLGTNFNLSGNGDETFGSEGIVDEADYTLWRRNYGQTSMMGGGGLASSSVSFVTSSVSVDEQVAEAAPATDAVDEAILVFDLESGTSRTVSAGVSASSIVAAAEESDLLLLLVNKSDDICDIVTDESQEIVESSDDEFSDVDEFFASFDELELAAF